MSAVGRLRSYISDVASEDEDEKLLRKRLRGQFRKMDRNGDGLLTRREFAKTFKSLGWEVSRDLLDKILDHMDADGDGRVSFAEFMEELEGKDHHCSVEKLMTRLRDRVLEKAQKCSLKTCFDNIDEDENGKVSEDEFYDGIREFGIHYTGEERAKLWDNFDISEDGYISFNEFHATVTDNWSEADYRAERGVKKAIRKLLKRFDEDGEDVADDIFEACDDDGDGKVDLEEFGTTRSGPFAKAIYRSMDGITEMQKRRIFAKIDASGDGSIGAAELRGYVESASK